MERGRWNSNLGFLLAAIGSAIGLGNIWRFSYVCHENGGGTFLIPYLIALVTTGIPLMILEFAIGHKMRASAPHSMHKIHPRWEWLGWWPVLFVMFGINLYYVVVIAWCALYMLFSLESLRTGQFRWGEDTEAFFFGDQFLNASEGVFSIGGIQGPILAMTLVIWFVLWAICARRVDRGVEVASKIFMPILLVLTTVLVVWGLFLDGALEGLREYVKADYSKLGDVAVWNAAFGQIFFSLSIGFGIMIAYASYLPSKTNLVRNAFITSIVNCSYSIFAGIAVFSVLGYMAGQQGVPVKEVVAGGPGLCFVVYPKAISALPALNGVFGVLFFLTLVLAGLTSAMSIAEAFVSAAIDKFGWPRMLTVSITCGIGALGSIIFTTQAGVIWLDIVDHFLNNYGLILVGLLECVLIGWYYRIDKLHFHMVSAKQGRYPMFWDLWWEWTVTFVVPTVLAFILGWSLIAELSEPYEGYPASALLMIGVGWLVWTFLVAGALSTFVRQRNRDKDGFWDRKA
ncbi:MAG: sodium-dependent transporter [bacterium]|nr:sodium-dependent transporter [bacterium]